MFDFTQQIIKSGQIEVGVEILLTGRMVYGAPVEDFKRLSDLLIRIKDLALSEIIAINIHNLERWDSLGVKQLVDPLLETNRVLSEKGRIPITIIGPKNSDRYRALRDKYPSYINTQILPWLETREAFISQVT